MKNLNKSICLPIMTQKSFSRDSIMKKITKTPSSNIIKYTKIEDIPTKITPFRYNIVK